MPKNLEQHHHHLDRKNFVEEVGGFWCDACDPSFKNEVPVEAGPRHTCRSCDYDLCHACFLRLPEAGVAAKKAKTSDAGSPGASPVTAFGSAIFAKLTDEQPGNVVISPVSVAMAMAIAQAGSREGACLALSQAIWAHQFVAPGLSSCKVQLM